jgi:hypothetical protein
MKDVDRFAVKDIEAGLDAGGDDLWVEDTVFNVAEEASGLTNAMANSPRPYAIVFEGSICNVFTHKAMLHKFLYQQEYHFLVMDSKESRSNLVTKSWEIPDAV